MADANPSPSSKRAKTADGRPTIGYWRIRGLAAPIKYQLAYSLVEFDEETYEQGDGPDFSRAAWLDVKNALGLEFPNLPYLKVDGMSLTESGAIHRFCAHKWRRELLFLENAESFAKSEMVWGVVSDLKAAITSRSYRGDGNKKNLSDFALPGLESLYKQVGEKGENYLIGSAEDLCCADFAFVELIEYVDFVSDGKVYEIYPGFKTYRDRIFSLPGLKEYYETCPKLPFNNKVAKINN